MPGKKYFAYKGELILGQPIELVIEPYPMQRRIPLASKCPDLIAEWYWEKNCGYGPDDFSFGSQVNVWWRCPGGIDHVWRQQINVRSQGHGCPACTSRQISVTNCLEELFPEIAKEWHLKLNKIKPSDVTAHCDESVHWQCPKNKKHVYKMRINERTREDGKESGCPHCRREITGLGLFPDLLRLFDRKRNEGIDPLTFPVLEKVWWKCPVADDHVWYAALWSSSAKTITCPCCRGRKASSTNNLTLSSLLNLEYDNVKNKLPPTEVALTSKTKVWWKCSICKHKWDTSPSLRHGKGSGCPACARRNHGQWLREKHRLKK